MTSAPDLSISIVNGNQPGLLEQCLRSIVTHTTSISYEIHLVAHNYDPVTLEDLERRWPGLVVHRVRGISGYSQNHNVALRSARGRHAAILNDDTVLGGDLFGEMVRFLDGHPELAGACPALRNADGSLQMGVRGRFTPFSFLAEQLKVDRLVPASLAARLGVFDRPRLPEDGRPVEIEAGTGACFVVRRSALEAIGFLDEDYFFGPDDIDWTTRLRRTVGPVMLLPGLSLTHLGGTTTGPIYYAMLPTVYAGCYTFFRRYYGAGAEWMVRTVLGCGWSALLAAAWALAAAFTHTPRAHTTAKARWNCVRFAFSPLRSPEVFARLRGARLRTAAH